MGKIQLPSSPPTESEQVMLEGETPRPSSLGIREQLAGETPRPSSLGIRKSLTAPPQSEKERQQPSALVVQQDLIAPPVWERPQSASFGGGQGQTAFPQPVWERPSATGVRQNQIVPPPVVWKQPQSSVVGIKPAQAMPSQSIKEKPQTSASRVRRGQQSQKKHTTLLYFISAFLIITIIASAGLHAAGLSLTTLFTAHMTATNGTSYPLPDVKPLFADTFINNASGWNQQSTPNKYAVAVGNNKLTIEVKQNKLLWEPLPGTLTYTDFVLAVNTVLTKGDQNSGYGVYIRGAANQNSDLATYYRFELYGDASYAIFKGVVDQNGNSIGTKIVDYTLNSAILKQGQPNRLMISAQGAFMSFIVNGQLVKTFSDQSYTSGSVALFASNLTQTNPDTQVQFSQFALYPLHEAKGE